MCSCGHNMALLIFWKFSQRFMCFVQSFDVLQDVFSTTFEALKLLNEALAFG